MILQELARYYERKGHDPDTALAPEGFEWKEIPFVIILDPSGQLRQIEDTRSPDGKKKRARSFLVPQGVKRTSGIAANLLWDHAEYVLGIDTKGDPGRAKRQHVAFLARVIQLPQQDIGVRAVTAFLAKIPFERLSQSPSWQEIEETNPNLSFQLTTDTMLVCERNEVVAALEAAPVNQHVEAQPRGICLISGETTEIKRVHPAIKGVWGAQTSGANIVSFNLRAFESYGKEQKQGENAPVGKFAAFAYTTALNHLLSKDSRQRMPVGDATAVFWATQHCWLEDSFSTLLGEPRKDNPDANTRDIEALYRSLEQGNLNLAEGDQTFFVLGLSPNAARLSIRFWLTGKVRDFSQRIVDHFDAIDIVHAPYEPRYLSVFRLLIGTAEQSKTDNILPNLAGDTLRAILTGLPFPETLLAAALRRIRAEREVTYPRAALIKACLNRKSRVADPMQQEELHVSLDPGNTNIGYRLGRLFAVLEKIQAEANPGLNATIRSRFYGAASSTPVTVFATLLKLSQHHLVKIEHRGWAVKLEKLLQEITSGIDGRIGFPTHLSIDDQGRFAIGYYHQLQSFYVKRTESTQGVQA